MLVAKAPFGYRTLALIFEENERLSQKVDQVRTIGVKIEQYAFRIARFSGNC